ncbi:hypothetical protein [Clostridium nigeriense]|uniref:hypothetical protein n=1 Tax=Clostridium nigeriense TaxID=1805470 RepID=UPI0008333F89|nr:hypothetical protein [Clostridium nigeriense]
MKLIGLSILCGIIGVLAILPFSINGSRISESFIIILWMIGFFSPGLYYLDKLIKKLKDLDS